MRPLPHGIILVFILAITAILAFHLPGREEIDGGEGGILAMVNRMEREPISPEWLRQPPLTLSCYGPLYYWVTGGVSRLTGSGASLLAGRLVSLLAGLVCLALIGAAVRRATGRLDAALLAALVFLVSEPVLVWLPLERVDFLALVFTLGAYLAAPRRPAAAALAVALGAFTRQTVVLDVVPIAVVVMATLGRGRALKFVALAGAFTLALWGLAIWQSSGYFFFAGLQANTNPLDPARGGASFSYYLYSVPGAGAILVALILALRERPGFFVRDVFVAGFLCHLVLDPFLASKIGSNVNYLLPVCALGATVIGIHGFPLLARLNEQRARVALAVMAMVLGIPAIVSSASLAKTPLGTPKCYAPVIGAIRNHPTPYVVADFEWMELALQAGATPLVNDPYLMNLLWGGGRIDRDAILAALGDGRVGWLLLDDTPDGLRKAVERFWPDEVLDAFRDNYRLIMVQRAALPKHDLYIYAYQKK
ncbi:MAG: hypothetical protein ABFD69_07805 [Candidatus Sumerlaeia bacterium]